jgi:hypothetical protein
MTWDFPFNGRGAFWHAPTPARRIAGIGGLFQTLKKSPKSRPGPDFYRRSQLPTSALGGSNPPLLGMIDPPQELKPSNVLFPG